MLKKLISIVVSFSLIFGLAACTIVISSGADTNPPETNSTDTVGDWLDNASLDSASVGEKNALRSAKNYLSIMAFSYSGLIRQLEFEKYTTDEAIYAADNCGADWNEQAVKKAKDYLNTMAFSHSGLIKQLEFEGFTTEEATHGADICGANWNEQAAKKAKSYLDTMAFSRDGLIAQLEFEGFTHDQAVYGVEANGL